MMDAPWENFYNSSYTYPSFPNVSESYDISEYISSHNLSFNGEDKSFIHKYKLGTDITKWVIFIFGAVGNGIVIWLLGFRIKRNPFMTYILNLAVADLGVLLSLTSLGFVYVWRIAWLVFFLLFHLTYSASQFILTVISIDRCVAVFFPLWHQCKRPPHLSTLICALIWVLCILLTGITGTLNIVNSFMENYSKMEDYYQFMVNAVLCLPVMTVATVALFIKVCVKAKQHQRRRLLTIVLLTLLFFILFAFPMNIMITLYFLPSIGSLLACLNSSINPIIYFLVGRQWKSRHRESMKMILQEVFKEEEGCREGTPV